MINGKFSNWHVNWHDNSRLDNGDFLLMVKLLALTSWISVLLLTWLIAVGFLPVDLLRVLVWIFFITLGVFAAAIATND